MPRPSVRPLPSTRHPVVPPTAAGHRPLLLAVALATGFAPLAVRAQPTGAQAIVGAASLSQQGNRLVVTTQNGAGGFSAINWQSFSVPAGSTTYFAQPGTASTSINRVVGPDPSAIFGTLGSNGRLVLVNPAGITVGAGAVVDTAGFTASTLRMSDADALAGRMRFDGGTGGALQVDGQVLARSGDVVLIGEKVQTGAAALVQSPQGATVLAAGQKVEVTGRGLEGIVFQVQAPAGQAVNLGTLQGDAVGVFAGTLKHSGLIQAQSVSVAGGRVVLQAADQALVAGAVRAQGANGMGGSVDVLGTTVGVLAGATIDTGNAGGGGQIRVGGDDQGRNPLVPNAQVTYVDSAAKLTASATGQGDGGKVIVWADDTTRMHGAIQANAGPRGGDGGFVETSGKRFLDARGARVTATATQGRAGTWLLDPDDLTIVAGPAPTSAPAAPPENYGGTTPDFTPGSTGGASVIYDSTLNAALNSGSGTNVSVTTDASHTSAGSASGDIVLQGNLTLYRDQPGAATLTLNAYNDIRFTGGTPTFQASQPATPAPTNPPRLNVVLNPGMASTLASGPGSVVIESDAGLLATTTDPAGAVAVSVRGGKGLTNNGTLTLDPGTSLSADAVATTGTLDVNGGSLRVGSFAQGSGVARIHNGGNLTATQGFAASSGTFDFDGAGTIDLTQQDGDLVVPMGFGSYAMTSGPMSLRAATGSIRVGTGLITRGADVTMDAAGSIVFTSIQTGASRDASLSSAGGHATLTAGKDVTGDQVETSAWGTSDGASAAAGRITIASGAGTSASRGGSVAVRDLSAYGANGGDGGAVDLSAYGGDVAIPGSIRTGGGSAAYVAGYVGNGGASGDVRVTSTRDTAGVGGNIALGVVDTWGGAGVSGGRGGTVTLSATRGSVSVDAVQAQAGYSDSGTLASGAGSLLVTAGTGIAIGSVDVGTSSDSPLPLPLADLHTTGGDIVQTGSVTAPQLLARADAGSVLLGSPDNVIETVAGTAAGAFVLRSRADVTVGTVTAADATAVGGIKADSVSLSSAGGMAVVGDIVATRDISLTVNDPTGVVSEVSMSPGYGSMQVQGALTSTAGPITLQASSAAYQGATIRTSGPIDAGAGATVIDAVGLVDVGGSVRGASVDVRGDEVNVGAATVAATAGGLRITGNGPVQIQGSSLSASGGDLAVSGGAGYSLAERSGLAVTDSTLRSSGSLTLAGGTSDYGSAGLALGGTVQLDAAGGSTLTGSNYNMDAYGSGVSINSTLLSGSGALTIQGRSSGWGSAVGLSGATVAWNGNVAIQGFAAADATGIDLFTSTLTSGGGAIALGTTQAITAYGTTLDSGGGNIALAGGNDALYGVGVTLTASSVHAQTGNVSIAGKSGNDLGFRFQASGGLTVSGADVLVTGSSSSGGTAILVDGETITSTRSMRLEATGGGIEIINGSTLTSTGAGPMVLQATPGSSPAYLGIRADATSVLATGSLRASGDEVMLQNVDFGSAGGALSGTAASGGFSVANNGAGPLQVGTVDGVAGVTATGPVTLITSGLLRLSQTVRSDAGPGSDAITLVANDLLTDGAGALSAPNDRWAVWLNAPTANLVGSPVSNSDALWGRTYGTDPLTEAGNRYLFQYRPTVSLAVAPITRTYDGTDLTDEIVVSAPGLVNASQYGNVFNQDLVVATVSMAAPSKNVGTYAITIDPGYVIPTGYLDGGATGATGTITPAALTVSGLSGKDKVYDGTTVAAIGGAGSLSGVVAGDDVVLNGVAATAAFADKNVGAAKAVTVTGLGLSGIDSGNYTLAQPALTASITPKALHVAGLTASDKTYDGTTSATINGTAGFTDLVPGDAVALLATPTGAFVDRNVGTGKTVNLSSSGLTGTDAPNYVLAPLTPLTASITPATLTVTGLTASNKVYDATTGATLAGTGSLSGVLGGDLVSLSGSASATFADRNVGTGKAVAVGSVGLAGADAGNYVVGPVAGLTADITPATLTVTGLAALGKVYDATTVAPLAGTAGVAGVLGTDAVALKGTPTGAFADKNVGTAKPVSVSGLGLSGADAGNYTLAPASGLSADITPAVLTVSGLLAANKVYDATTAATVTGAASLGGVLGSDTVGIAGSAAGAFADKNVGANKPVTVSGLGLSGADAANYQLVATPLAARITPATLTLGGVSAVDKVYDATTSATLAGTAGAVGVLRTDSVALAGAPTAGFADKDVGSGKPVTVGLAGVALTGADAGNYVLAAPTGLAASITPAPLVIAANDQNKLQGNGLSFTGTEFRATGLVGGETIAAVSLASTGAAADAGTGSYPIAASGPVVAGAGFQSANYLVSYRPGTLVVSALPTPVQQQVLSEVLSFQKLYTQETLTQSPPAFDDNGKPKGRPDIVSTDGSTCRPV